MSQDIRHQGQKDMNELLDRTLRPRIDTDIPSIAQGNTPEVNTHYHMVQQVDPSQLPADEVDIQRRDQKPHHAPLPPENPDAVSPGMPDEPAPPEPDDAVAPAADRYISRTPYHR